MDHKKTLELAMQLDSEFQVICHEIRTHPDIVQRLNVNKAERIRVDKWLDRLSEARSFQKTAWKKNRNLYAKLLLSQLKQEFPLEQPFAEAPKFAGLLPMLPKWLSMYTHGHQYVKTTKKMPSSVKEVMIFEDSHKNRLFSGFPKRTITID